MIEFDRYDLTTWVDEKGVVVVSGDFAKEQTRSTSRLWNNALGRMLSSSIVAVGVTAASLSFAADVAVSHPTLVVASPNSVSMSSDDATPEHWRKLSAFVRSAKILPPDDMSNDPPPLG